MDSETEKLKRDLAEALVRKSLLDAIAKGRHDGVFRVGQTPPGFELNGERRRPVRGTDAPPPPFHVFRDPSPAAQGLQLQQQQQQEQQQQQQQQVAHQDTPMPRRTQRQRVLNPRIYNEDFLNF